jgi:hypothetical protein
MIRRLLAILRGPRRDEWDRWDLAWGEHPRR